MNCLRYHELFFQPIEQLLDNGIDAAAAGFDPMVSLFVRGAARGIKTFEFGPVGRQEAMQPKWRNAFISVCVVGAAIYALCAPIAG